MKLLIKNGKVIDPKTNRNGVFDVLISGGRIKDIRKNIKRPVGRNQIELPLWRTNEKTSPKNKFLQSNSIKADNAQVINAKGKIITPGLVDVHVHFREPGFEYKETIESGSRAAAAGGYTTVVMEPNTLPPVDTPSRTAKMLKTAKKTNIVNVYTKAAITKGTRGGELTDIKALKKAGAVAISDDGNPVPGKRLMHNALKASKLTNILVSPHCEESKFYRDKIKPKLRNMKTAQYCSEADFIKRDIELAKKTGARLHISHVSLAESVELITKAKKEGVNITAEATPHHLLLTKEDAKKIGTNAKVNPPIRMKKDVKKVKEGLINGALDIIASDHAPHTTQEKSLPWNSSKKEAPFGLIGLETTLALVLTYLVKPGLLTMVQAVEKLSFLPAKIFGLEAGGLKIGAKADLTIIDPNVKWKIDASKFYSKSRNCPFNGWRVQGKAVMTIVNGRVVMKDGKILK